MENDAVQSNIIQELRRGVIILAVLAELHEAQYGYSILRLLGEQGLEIDQGTLYPLLRRLESQGLLESSWKLEEARPRRYYVTSPAGKQTLIALRQEYERLADIMDKVLGKELSE